MRKERDRKELIKIHPGFQTTRSVVLHRFATDDGYQRWRSRLAQGEFIDQILTVTSSGSFASPVAVDVRDIEGPQLGVSNAGARTLPEEPVATDRPVIVEREVIVDGRVVVERTKVALNGTGIPAPLPPSGAPVAVDLASQQVFTAPHFHPSVSGPMGELRMQVEMGRNPMSGVTRQIGNFALLRSQRNPTPLFGLGLLDAIDEETLVEASLKKHKNFPEVSGRVARLKDGRIGRFGWKSQIVSLEDFTLTACAVELGLDVPKHPQAGSTQKPKYKSPGHEMTQAQADALVAFMSSLPAPKQRRLTPGKHRDYIDGGEALFAKVGCATCHVKNLGDAEGVFFGVVRPRSIQRNPALRRPSRGATGYLSSERPHRYTVGRRLQRGL